MNTKSILFFLWMNFAAKHQFLFSITAFVLLCAWRVMFLTQNFLLAAYNRIFGKCWALQHERLQFWIYSHMCVALLGSILWQDPLSLPLPPTVSSVTFQACLTSRWTVGCRKDSRGEGGSPTLLLWSRTKSLCNDSFSFWVFGGYKSNNWEQWSWK